MDGIGKNMWKTSEQKDKSPHGISRESLTEEPRYDGTLTGFGQREEEANVVQVSSCSPGLLDQMVARLQSTEQHLAEKEYSG